MDRFDECSTLNALDVDSIDMGASRSRFDHSGCRSDRAHKRRRWSPYSKKRKLLPKKAFSLETIPVRPQIERSRSFELTQSTDITEDQVSIQSEPVSAEWEKDDVPDTTQTTEWLLSSMEGGLEEIDDTCSHQPTDAFNRFAEIQPVNEPTHSCENDASIVQSNSLQSSGPDSTGQPVVEWLLWCAYSKLMKLAWRTSRKNLKEQNHRAENCELQAKLTMKQVSSLKTQLKADVSEMTEQAMKLQSARALVDATKGDKLQLQSENEILNAKLESLKEDRNRLKDELSETYKELRDYNNLSESLTNQVKTSDEELCKLKDENDVLDSEIQQCRLKSRVAKEIIEERRKDLYNKELENSDIQREIEVCEEKIRIESRMVNTVKEQTRLVTEEIRIAEEDGKKLQKQLEETRQKVLGRDLLISELSGKVDSATEQISEIKKDEESAGKKSFWRRIRFLPKDSNSLLSIQL